MTRKVVNEEYLIELQLQRKPALTEDEMLKALNMAQTLVEKLSSDLKGFVISVKLSSGRMTPLLTLKKKSGSQQLSGHFNPPLQTLDT